MRGPGFNVGIEPLRLGLAVLAALALLASTPVAGDESALRAGRDVAAGCASCHGTNGTANRVSPPLAGQARTGLTAKLKAFKTGEREGTVMPQLARGYSDTELEQAAAWFSQVPGRE